MATSSTSRRIRAFAAAFTCAAALFTGAAFAQEDRTFGVWRADDGNAHVQLSPCDAHGLCGDVVWVAEGAAQAQTNAEGFRIQGTFHKTEDGWSGGRVFLPTRGRAYRTTFKPQDDGTLQVRACGFVIFCETHYWTPVE